MNSNEVDIDKSFNVKGIKYIYLFGLILWLILFPLFFFYNKNINSLQSYDMWYIAPYLIGIFVMIWHVFHWWEEYRSPGYKTEISLIEFAERNTSYLLIGISFLNYMVIKEYFLLIAMYTSLIVLFLLYVSESKKEKLVMLRHWKTLPYTYAICFFLSGIVSILGKCPVK